MSIHIVRENEIQAGTLPNNFEASKVDGIICIEMFDPQYSELVTSLGLPTIFIDCSVDIFCPDLKADLLLMENEHSVYSVTKSLIDRGFTRIGFIGDYKHCKSFNERWVGYNRALIEAGQSVDLSCCIVDQDRNFFSESDWMDKQLEGMSVLPSAFVCANDFIAVSVMKALKNKNLKIPEDIAVFGFDNAPESRIVEPHLSTVHIYNNEMGIMAAEMLLARVKDPSRPYQITHIRTEPIFRESTPLQIEK